MKLTLESSCGSICQLNGKGKAQMRFCDGSLNEQQARAQEEANDVDKEKTETRCFGVS